MKLRVPPERDLPPGRLVERKAHLMGELTENAHGARSVSGLRRRRWPIAVLVPAAGLALAAAAYGLVARAPEEVVNGIGCYEAADLRSNTTIVSADGRDPVSICRELWEQGVVSGVPESPPLVACVSERGQGVAVFPGGPDTCRALGTALLPQGYEEAATRFAAMHQEMIDRFGREDCITEERARQIAREVLDGHGFTDWRVIDGAGTGDGFSSGRPCASLAFDAVGRSVILVPEETPVRGAGLEAQDGR